MTLLEVLYRPSMAELARSRKHPGVTCLFWVRPVDSGSKLQFRLNVRVTRAYHRLVQSTARFSLVEQDSGLSLVAEVNSEDRWGGTIDAECPNEKIMLRWAGVEPATCRLLAAHRIYCLGDLKRYTEATMCAMLFPPGTNYNEKTVDEAIVRYVQMRNRLKKTNLAHNLCADGAVPASADRLRVALFT